MTWLFLVLLATANGSAHADGTLRDFLRSVEATGDASVALRGDGQMEVDGTGGVKREPVALIVRPPADALIALRTDGLKALLLQAGDEALLLPRGAAKAETWAPDAALAGSDFTREDLQPFRMSRYKDMRISDDSGNEITVTFFPDKSQYSLVVITFDRDKQVPIKTIYYKDTVNNAVKMRRDGDYALVGRKWLPSTISMQSFKLKTHTKLTLRWTQNPTFPPELFDPAFLLRATLEWPPAAP